MAVLLNCGWVLGYFLMTAIWKATHLCISALLFSVCEDNWDKRDPELGRGIRLALGCRWKSGPSPPCQVYQLIFSFFFTPYSKQQMLCSILSVLSSDQLLVAWYNKNGAARHQISQNFHYFLIFLHKNCVVRCIEDNHSTIIWQGRTSGFLLQHNLVPVVWFFNFLCSSHLLWNTSTLKCCTTQKLVSSGSFGLIEAKFTCINPR